MAEYFPSEDLPLEQWHLEIFDPDKEPLFYTSRETAQDALERMMEADLFNPKFHDGSLARFRYSVIPLGNENYTLRRSGTPPGTVFA